MSSKRAIINEQVRGGIITQVVGQGMLDNGTTQIVEQQGAAVATVATADAAGAAYDASEETLLNECKDQVNALLVSLRAAGLIAT